MKAIICAHPNSLSPTPLRKGLTVFRKVGWWFLEYGSIATAFLAWLTSDKWPSYSLLFWSVPISLFGASVLVWVQHHRRNS